jgi:drug/metabolite transporter (DMT)-like permease
VTSTRLFAFTLLAAANLLWAGNWVIGRALRDAFDPVTANFWRWFIASVLLAPFALAGLVRKRAALRRHAGIVLLLSFTGVVAFQTLVYLGLRTTTTINAVLLNSASPLFVLLCAWFLERERTTLRQIAGMLISLAGILVILSRGEPGHLLELEVHPGDAWILLAVAIWGLYSVLLKRRPAELDGVEFLFALSVAGVLMMFPLYGLEVLREPPRWPTPAEAMGLVYFGLCASVLGFTFWNRGVATVGANAAGFTLHLLPAFGTVLAIILLGEAFGAFHAVGIATILAGVFLATSRP